MKVQAIRTDKGNWLAEIEGVYAYCNKDFSRILRLTDEREFAYAKENWGNPVQEYFQAERLAWFLRHTLVAPLVEEYKQALRLFYSSAHCVGSHNGQASSWGEWCGRVAIAEWAGSDCQTIAKRIIDMQ